MEYVFVLHVTRTPETGPLPIVPLALDGVHVCQGEVGDAATLTA
jgi:hypothetical protein